MAQALEFLRNQGRFPFEELVTHRFPLDRVMEAIETPAVAVTRVWWCHKLWLSAKPAEIGLNVPL
jgi:hypothetical protein